jgi:uncharacterized hydrophobic protein (TIGR00341 family)
MSFRLIEVRSDINNKKMLDAIVEKKSVLDSWNIINNESKIKYSILAREENVQEITDAIMTTLGYTNTIRVIVTSVEATMPKFEEKKEEDVVDTTSIAEKVQESKMGIVKNSVSITPKLDRISREELYENIEKGAILNKNFLMFVFFSIIVGAIGIIEDNTTIVIGSMVIAPLLGPVMAFVFAIAIADEELMTRSTRTTLAGLGLSLLISICAGFIWYYNFGDVIYKSTELMDRTTVHFGDLALALMSGAAAALSITSGMASALVGVVIAVAILPPVATVGIMIGAGNFTLATSALLLLMVNLVCINLSAQIIFMIKKVTPRTSGEKYVARNAIIGNLVVTFILIGLLSIAIYFIEDIKRLKGYTINEGEDSNSFYMEKIL